MPPSLDALWQGRADMQETGNARRWHQVIAPVSGASACGVALLGLASDAGVVRNMGRSGASQGPTAIRRQLANLAYHLDDPLFDAGDIDCKGDALEAAQSSYADRVVGLLNAGHRVIGLGGGHEIAFASFSGLLQQRLTQCEMPRIGILNIDAHLDLRLSERPSSGTPFLQCAELSHRHGLAFQYCCLGVSRTANTQALFERAQSLGVDWVLDEHCLPWQPEAVVQALERLLEHVDELYLTICLDAFPASRAPGVSAPSNQGIELSVVEWLIDYLKARITIPVADVAELNPMLDIDQRTARLAARLVERLAR